ncbi:hypothetical protein BDZ97DRAFT_2015541 [Flammula alnicola]|nr:hypothetical protein BDZ97DRAFT_2015541 [Flammula alnicola]
MSQEKKEHAKHAQTRQYSSHEVRLQIYAFGVALLTLLGIVAPNLAPNSLFFQRASSAVRCGVSSPERSCTHSRYRFIVTHTVPSSHQASPLIFNHHLFTVRRDIPICYSLWIKCFAAAATQLTQHQKAARPSRQRVSGLTGGKSIVRAAEGTTTAATTPPPPQQQIQSFTFGGNAAPAHAGEEWTQGKRTTEQQQLLSPDMMYRSISDSLNAPHPIHYRSRARRISEALLSVAGLVSAWAWALCAAPRVIKLDRGQDARQQRDSVPPSAASAFSVPVVVAQPQQCQCEFCIRAAADTLIAVPRWQCGWYRPLPSRVGLAVGSRCGGMWLWRGLGVGLSAPRRVFPYPSPNASPRARYGELEDNDGDLGVNWVVAALGWGWGWALGAVVASRWAWGTGRLNIGISSAATTNAADAGVYGMGMDGMGLGMDDIGEPPVSAGYGEVAITSRGVYASGLDCGAGEGALSRGGGGQRDGGRASPLGGCTGQLQIAKQNVTMGPTANTSIRRQKQDANFDMDVGMGMDEEEQEEEEEVKPRKPAPRRRNTGGVSAAMAAQAEDGWASVAL